MTTNSFGGTFLRNLLGGVFERVPGADEGHGVAGPGGVVAVGDAGDAVGHEHARQHAGAELQVLQRDPAGGGVLLDQHFLHLDPAADEVLEHEHPPHPHAAGQFQRGEPFEAQQPVHAEVAAVVERAAVQVAGLNTRATLRRAPMLLDRLAPTRLISSLLVTASTRSADCTPAWNSVTASQALPLHRLHVELFPGDLQDFGVRVDQADVVLGPQHLADAGPHGPAPEDDDVHGRGATAGEGRGGGGRRW